MGLQFDVYGFQLYKPSTFNFQLAITAMVRVIHTMKKYLVYVMGALYVLAGINHFSNPSFYVIVMPTWLPAHLLLIYISGVAEILLGAGLWLKQTRRISAWLIVAMLIVFIPLHVDMIINPKPMPDVPASKLAIVNAVLWVRIALQFLFIYWAWVCTKEEKA